MRRPPRPQWQQATALITIGAGSVATGLTFVPKAAADLTSPASVPPVTLVALEHANAPAPGRDAMLRAAIVHIARHFLRLAETRSPAEMDAMIWQYASTDGANHGPSCAAFASLTLELGSHIAGLDSWVTGGASYPWPVHAWVDGRVDPNPASPGVVSVLQDARTHGRWHPAGDGYAPQPGDWVLFDGHVEVVTKYHGGVLHTIGGDSLPNMSVNAHEYSGPMQDQGVAGFVDNGVGMSAAPTGADHAGSGRRHSERAAAIPGSQAPAAPTSSADPSPPAGAASPGSDGTASGRAASGGAASGRAASGGAASGRAASGGAASGRAASGVAASGGAAPSASPATTAGATGQQSELAPRAVSAPPTVPQSRFAQESRAVPAQGARRAPRGEHASGAGSAARTTAEPQRPIGQPTGTADSRAGRAARPANQHPQPAGQRPEHSDRSQQHADRSQQHADRSPQHGDRRRAMTADVPATGLRPARPHHARRGEAAIPGLFKGAHQHHPGDVSGLPPYHRHDVPPSNAPQPGTATQQAFINEVAQGAMATQDRYGVPASVTIAQAIDESGWGQSLLATNDHNLFGIKGTGPAGSDEQPTQEVINGQVVNLSASFQIYENIAQSIDAHGRLLAHGGDYAGAMSQSSDPNAFAAALTGVYATDPSYGAKLIQLMKQYDLYRFNQAAARSEAPATHHGARPTRPARNPGANKPGGGHHPDRSPRPPASPGPRQKSPGHDRKPMPGPIGNPVPVQPAPIAEPTPTQPAPIANPAPLEPGPLAPAHDATPARATKTGASAAARQAGTPSPGQTADQKQTVQHSAATQPTAVLYPGRSARPAPLAHPARPADLTGPSDPTPDSSATATVTSGGSSIPGAQPSADAGSVMQPAARRAHAPGHAATATVPSGGSSIPGAGTGPVWQASVGPAWAPAHAPTATAPSGGSSIPGASTGPVSQASVGPARAPAHPTTAPIPSGGSSMPGAQPGADTGSASRASARPAIGPSHQATAPTGRAATPGHQLQTGHAVSAPGHTATAPTSQPTARGHASAAPGRATAAPTRPTTAPPGQPSAPGHDSAAPARSASAPRHATAPGHVATSPNHAATAPTRAVPAPTGQRAAPGHPAAASSHAGAGGGTAQPSGAAAAAAPTAGSALRSPASAGPAPESAQAAARPMATATSTPAPGGADVPGLVHGAPATAPPATAAPAGNFNGGAATTAGMAGNSSRAPGGSSANNAAPSSTAGATLTVYHAHMPPSVRESFVKSAKTPLVRSEPLYRDVASHTGIRWELLAACDWMQCKARHGYSPVYGEKLGSLNPDDTCYRTKSAALEQCASDLVQLARSVYQLDIATSHELSVRDLANVFAAFRWGGLLRQHCTSAMDFPYSVAGLTADHTHMRWPNIDEPNAPDKPGGRFRQPFGAVPVVLGLNYQALM